MGGKAGMVKMIGEKYYYQVSFRVERCCAVCFQIAWWSLVEVKASERSCSVLYQKSTSIQYIICTLFLPIPQFSSGVKKLLSERVNLWVAMRTDGTVGGYSASTLKAGGLVSARNEDSICLTLLTVTANPCHWSECSLVDFAELLHGTCPWKLGISLQRWDPVWKSPWRHHSCSLRWVWAPWSSWTGWLRTEFSSTWSPRTSRTRWLRASFVVGEGAPRSVRERGGWLWTPGTVPIGSSSSSSGVLQFATSKIKHFVEGHGWSRHWNGVKDVVILIGGLGTRWKHSTW